MQRITAKIFWFVLLTAVCGVQVHAQSDVHAKMNSIGAGASYLRSDNPLEPTTGFRVRYAHLYEVGHPPSDSSDPAAINKRIQQALLLVTGVSAMRMDREAAGSALEGQLSFTQLSAALLWSPSSKRKKWGWGVGAAVDYFIAEGKGTFEVPAPLGVSNRYDVDSGPGFHAEVDWTYALGKPSAILCIARLP